MSVFNSLELEGSSPDSWEAAAREALAEAGKTIRGISRMEILGTSAAIRGGLLAEYRALVRITFQVEPRS